MDEEGALILYCDGCCEPRNPGGCGGFGWWALWQGKHIAEGSGTLGTEPTMTNNRAEYAAVIEALKWAKGQRGQFLGHGAKVIVRSDSQLVVRQIEGRYQVRSETLRPLHAEAMALIQEVGAVAEWIKSNQNTYADELSRKTGGAS